MNPQTTEVTGVTLMTDTGAAENRTAGTVGEVTDEEGQSSGEDGPANDPDSGRLLERGIKLHALSADEEDCTDAEMDARDLTPEEAAAATAVLDAPNENDQEGLALTGGDWFNTIKQVAKNNKEAEKELAARMKKAKISQTSLENKVFEGEPSDHSSADAGPGLLRNESPPPSSHPLPMPTTKKADPDPDRDLGPDPVLDPGRERDANSALDLDPASTRSREKK
jgi:hypothetical protein